MRRAHELLGGRPSLIQMNDAWTFGCPSALFLYHSKPGRLDEELADMSENCGHYFALTQGHGSGGDVLMEAEAYYHRGEMENASGRRCFWENWRLFGVTAVNFRPFWNVSRGMRRKTR